MVSKSQYNFSGGMNAGVSNLLLKDNEAELVVNYSLDKVGALTKRKGTLLYGGQIGSADVTGIFHFVSSTAANSAVLMTTEAGDINRLYTSTLSGAITTASTSLTLADATNFGATGLGSGQKRIEIDGDFIEYGTKTSNTLSDLSAAPANVSASHSSGATVRTWRSSKTVTATGKWRFMTLLDYVFAMNDTVVVATSAAPAIGSGWGTTNAPATITPSFGIVYKDKGYMSGDSTNPNKLYFSSKINPTDTTITWDVTNDYIPVDPENGDKIKGLGLNGNVMLVFKEFATYRWDGNAIDTEPVIDVGTTSHDTIQTIHGITFFANRQGVWAYTKGQPKLISRKIQKWWDAVNVGDFANLVAWTDYDHYYISITPSTNNITVDGVTYSTGVTLVYSVPLNAWTIETGNRITAAATVTDPQDSNRYSLIGIQGQGHTTILHTGTSDAMTVPVDSANYRDIPGQFISKEQLINFPKKARPDNLYVSMQQAVGSQVNYRLDRSTQGFTPAGECTKRVSEFDLKGEGGTIQVEITDNSKNQSIIEGFTAEYDAAKTVDKTKI